MFRLYSKGCEYTIRALAMAQDGKEKMGLSFSAKDICERAGLPEWYTRKVFQNLVREGILKAHRGPGGGYVFSGDPQKISILAMIKAIDGKDALEGCVMGPGRCKDRRPCPLHKKWKNIKEKLVAELKSISVRDLIGSMSRHEKESTNSNEEVSKK